MNVVGVISSANRQGSTAALVREALGGAGEAGATVTELFLPDFRLAFCTGCQRCMTEGRCMIDDAFESIRKMLEAADGIILGAPTYSAAPNAIMKNLIDRLGLLEVATSSVFGGKYVLAISTAKRSGAKKTTGYLTGIVRNEIFKRGYIVGTLEGKIGQKSAADFPALMNKARLQGRRIAEAYEKKKQYPLQNLPGRIITGLLVKPMFCKAIYSHREGFMKGAYGKLKDLGWIG